MPDGIKAFRGLVHTKFRNESEMARKLNWKRQRLNKITNGIKEPSVRELNAMAEAMDVDVCSIIHFFLPESHQMGNSNN